MRQFLMILDTIGVLCLVFSLSSIILKTLSIKVNRIESTQKSTHSNKKYAFVTVMIMIQLVVKS